MRNNIRIGHSLALEDHQIVFHIFHIDNESEYNVHSHVLKILKSKKYY